MQFNEFSDRANRVRQIITPLVYPIINSKNTIMNRGIINVGISSREKETERKKNAKKVKI